MIQTKPPLPDSSLFHGAQKVAQKLREAGYECYLVGGSIRDLVLGREAKDFDITTNAIPSKVQELFPRNIPVGIEFGTVVVLEKEHAYEVTTFRCDGHYSDGRHPDAVTFGTVQEDIQRRDFTMNGLLLDPFHSEIIDYCGGIKDIEKKVICTIGDPFERFKEDHLRMLRAVRFSSQLGFEMESNTEKAIQQLSPKIREISHERIQQELSKWICGSHLTLGYKKFDDSGMLDILIPFLLNKDFLLQRFHFLESQSLAWSEEVGWVLFLEGNLWEDVESFFLDFRFSNEKRNRVLGMLQHLELLKGYCSLRVADRKRFLQATFVKDIFLLADILEKENALFHSNRLQAQKEQDAWSQEELWPCGFVSGKDLIRLGFRPGPLFKQILLELETMELEGWIRNQQEGIRWVESHYNKEKL